MRARAAPDGQSLVGGGLERFDLAEAACRLTEPLGLGLPRFEDAFGSPVRCRRLLMASRWLGFLHLCGEIPIAEAKAWQKADGLG